MTKILTIVSGKGGVGKTTTTINLAMALNSYGKSVAIVDANLTTPNIGIYLGVHSVPVSIHDVLQNKNKLLDAMYQHPSGVKVIPGDIGFSSLDEINLEALDDALLDLEGVMDYVLIDGAAGLGEEAAKAISVCDGVIVVTNPEMPAVTDALKAVNLVGELRKPVTGVVINRFKRDGLDMEVNEIEKILEFPVVGAVEEDSKIRESMVKRNAVFEIHPKTEASRNYKRLAARLLDVEYNDRNEKVADLMEIFKKLFKDIKDYGKK
ncbi:MAG: septum site-determining protein MinD [Nanoarchaeota archaeon]|nr:septum site-determining protein MinD [Nanoarchaeota archaeon]